jgi:hypothetical protein
MKLSREALFEEAMSRSIHSRLIATGFDPENLKQSGIDGSSQIDERPLPTAILSCQEKKNFNPRRSLAPITIWRCARALSSKSTCMLEAL